MTLSARERIIVALDVPDLKAQREFLDRLDGQPLFYKVGLELFLSAGEHAVAAVKERGGRVFLDLKLHDIPETVARAVSTVARLGVDLLTVHAAGGAEMCRRAAVQAGPQIKVLAVTVLTSLSDDDLRADGIAGGVAETVIARARTAVGAGVAGLVCSPQEVAAVRAVVPQALLVVPGIRPAGAALGDQKRVGSPASAIAAGADHLVVGRPIRDAADPAAAFAALVQEVDGARGTQA